MEKYWKEPEIKAAFNYSESIIKYYAKSFSVAARFLPPEKRWATYAIYSFCRFVDNIVDKPRNRSREEISIELKLIRDELNLAFKYSESEHPVILSFIYVVKKYNIPLNYAFDLIDGVEMDLNRIKYNTFDDLYLFCYRVASVVGLMMCYVLGFSDPKALIHAEYLGVAMQLTNILRDIKEDKDNGRIYLPMKELNDFGLSEDMIYNEIYSEQFKEFLIFQTKRAEKFYDDSYIGIPMLDANSRFAIYSAAKIYRGILDKLKAKNFNPFEERVFVPLSEKLLILIQELIKSKTGYYNVSR